MTMMFLMIPVALLMSAGAVAAFVWAVRRGQLDDLVTPAVRMLHDDERATPPGDRGQGSERRAGVDMDSEPKP